MEKINVREIDRQTLKKIHIIKMLMESDDYCGERKTIFVTETIEQLYEQVDGMRGLREYKEFYRNFADYIDRTVDIKAKNLYNIVIVNQCDISLDEPIELLYRLFAVKGLLNEYVMITGDKDEAERSKKESKCLYYINDEWKPNDDGEQYRANEDVKLLKKLRCSGNIYITAMNAETYAKLCMLDSFRSVFPNRITIDELTVDEKLDFICSVAGEYQFNIDKTGFNNNKFIREASIEKIETSVRQAVLQKLSVKDKSCCLSVTDVDTGAKIKNTKKIAAYTELENLIGLYGVKKSVHEITTFLKRRGRTALPCLHMAFLGNPGTAKTTVARIIAHIFAETGVTKKNLLVETDREGLVGAYVGHTAIKTKDKINEASGGVLFIDEAYSLFTGDRDKIDYGNEAVATLVKYMEDKRDDFICILAGYTKEMNDMLSMNPGMRDRISFYIDFPDYGADELLQIFEKMCRDNKYRLSESAADMLKDGFNRIVRVKGQNFSNGRLVRKIFERVRMKQALRASNSIISDADIIAAFAESDISAMFGNSKSVRIGFGA